MKKEMQKNNGGFVDGSDLDGRLWEVSWVYIKTIVDIVREPILILDKNLRVLAANESFCHMFQVEARDTESKVIYELGNGQWNIPPLRKLLEDILPMNTFFKGFEVSHEFPFIGKKVMILNAKQIHLKDNLSSEHFPPIILLAIEDVTAMMAVAETLAVHVKELAAQNAERTHKLELQIGKLQNEINEMRK